MSKKTVEKKETKKVVAKPKTKVIPTKKLDFPKKKVEKKIKVDKAHVELVSFSVTAVIPTQQFGNIQPRIEVKASTMDEAHSFVKPILEDLYRTYSAELPVFMKDKVTVTERTVPAETIKETPKAETQKPDMQNTYTAPAKVETVAGHPIDSKEVPFGPETKSEAYLKAENSIASAQTMESLDLIQKKVNESVKIDQKDKPFLDTLILKKKKTIPLA